MKYVLFVQLLPSIKKNEPSAAGIGYATEPEAEPNVRRGKDMSRVPHGTRLSYGIFFLPVAVPLPAIRPPNTGVHRPREDRQRA